MGTRFTRVTVVGDDRQIDVSLPAEAPLVEQLPTVLRLLSVPVAPAPVRWRLAAPEFGALDPATSLDRVGVLDGAVLHLTEAAAAPLPPFVDDVETAVADLVADTMPAWSGPARTDVVGALLTVVLSLALGVAVFAPAPTGWPALALVAVAAVGIGRLVPGRGGGAAALVAVPALAALVPALATARPELLDAVVGGPPAGAADAGRPVAAVMPAAMELVSGRPALALAMVLFGALGLTAAGIVRRAPGVVVAALLAVLVATAALLCVRLGLPADRTAGLALVVAVVLSGLAGQLALGGAGLVDLMVADERGEPVPRQRVVSAVRRGLALVTGVVWVAALVAAVACWVLVTGHPAGAGATWQAPALGVLGGLVFGLRSRMFTRAHQVGTMLLVVTVAAAAAAAAAPRWLALDATGAPRLTLGLLAGVGVVLLGAGLRSLREVAGARLQRLLERIELLAVLALVPGLVLLFQVIPTVQRWWG